MHKGEQREKRERDTYTQARIRTASTVGLMVATFELNCDTTVVETLGTVSSSVYTK